MAHWLNEEHQMMRDTVRRTDVDVQQVPGSQPNQTQFAPDQFAAREAPSGKGHYRAGRSLIRGQLGRRLELQRLVPQRHIGLTDVATDSERHSSRYGADRQAESTRPGEGTTRVRLKRCDLVACLAHVGMQVAGILARISGMACGAPVNPCSLPFVTRK